MPSRISTRSIYDTMLDTLLSSQQKVNRLQYGIADGKKLRVPSDDPVGAHLALRSRSRLSAIGQYQRNLEGGMNHLDATDAVLTQIEDLVSNVRALAAQGANDTLQAEDRQAIAEQVNQFIHQLIELANQNYSGVRLFGGRNSEDAPFEAVVDAEGKVVNVVPTRRTREEEQPTVRMVDRDVLLTIHARASDVFGQSQELFKSYIALRDALATNNTEAIQKAGSAIDDAQGRLLAAHGVVGTLIQRAEALQEQLARDELSHEAERSSVEDLDVAEAMLNLSQQQTALQAALAAGARVLNLSLLDYLS